MFGQGDVATVDISFRQELPARFVHERHHRHRRSRRVASGRRPAWSSHTDKAHMLWSLGKEFCQ